MSLQRKENNLRKAQSRFDRITNPPRWKVISHLRNREFQLDFRREQTKSVKFRTRAYIVRDVKSYHGNNRGILHKAVNSRFRIKGDAPSVTRLINSYEPTTKKGKLLKKTAQVGNFALHDVKQTAVDTALAAETVGLKGADVAQREVRNKLKQKYTREAVDDYHRGVFFMGKTAVDAFKGTHQHFKQKKQHKIENAKFKLKKADHAVFKVKTYQPKLKANKADLKSAKAEYKSKIVKDKGNHLRKAMNKRRSQAFKQSERELKFERKQIVTEKKFKVKELKNQRKIAKASDPGLLILKPATYTAGRMKASAWQKAVNEDQDNDMLHAVDSAKRRVAEPIKDKVSKPQRLHRQEKKRDGLSDKKLRSEKKLNKQENRLKNKHDSYKKCKKKPKPKSGKKAKNSLANAVKKAIKFVKNVCEKEVIKFFATIAIPILIILLVFAFITMIFSSTSSGGSFLLGTYAAQDYDLSEAEKYYTELAYNFNQKILKVSDSDTWKDGLADFGANKNDLKDAPNNWYWGKSSVYDWEPQYDFDCYKLWAFLCAYYYDFDAADNGDIKYWKFKDGTKTLLEEIFNAEYEFVFWYDNTSGWEYKYQFDSRGYYSIDGSGVSGEHGYINISYPDALPFQGYNNGNTIYFDLSNGEVLNCNDNYSATGWYLKNQFVDDYDNSGTKYGAWYWYDGNGGTKRDTEVTIANAVLLSGFSEGDTINDGQEFAKTTAENVNFHIYIDTDGYGWDYIDPRLVLY